MIYKLEAVVAAIDASLTRLILEKSSANVDYWRTVGGSKIGFQGEIGKGTPVVGNANAITAIASSDSDKKPVTVASRVKQAEKNLPKELKKYSKNVKVKDLDDNHREAIKDYNLEVVGKDVRQAVAIAKRLKKGIEDGTDVCKDSPPVCIGNMGLTRDKMPQIEGEKTVKQMLNATNKDGTPKEADRAKGKAMVAAGADPDSDETILDKMIKHLDKNGVKTKPKTISVGELKATQKEILSDKTYSMADSHLKGTFPGIDDSVVISRDGHILDGHHRWAALMTIDPKRKMNVRVVDMDMKDLLKESASIPGVYRADFKGKPLPDKDQGEYKKTNKSKFK